MPSMAKLIECAEAVDPEPATPSSAEMMAVSGPSVTVSLPLRVQNLGKQS